MGTDIMTNVLLITSVVAVAGAGVGVVKVLDRTGNMIEKSSSKIGTVLDNANRVLVDSNKMINNLDNKVDDFEELINDARKAAGSVQKAFDKVNVAADNLNEKIDKGGEVLNKADRVLSSLSECITELSEAVSKLENKGCDTLDGLRKDINGILNEIVSGDGTDERNIKGLIGKANDVLDRAAGVVDGIQSGNNLQGIIAGVRAVIDRVNMEINEKGGTANYFNKIIKGEKIEPGFYVKLASNNGEEKLIPLTISPMEISLPGGFDNERNRKIVNIIQEENNKSYSSVDEKIAAISNGMVNLGVDVYRK